MTAGQPARGYSWPPFEKGNQVGLIHGARSERAIAARADEVHAELLEHCPYLSEEKFIPEVARYLRASARELLAHEAVVKYAEEKGPDKIPPRLLEQCTAASRLASQLAAGLGLSPLGHAKIRALSIGADRAAMDSLEAKGRALRLAQGRPGLLEVSADDDDE